MYRNAWLLATLLTGAPVLASAVDAPAVSSTAAPATQVVVRQGDASVTLADVDAYAATMPDDLRAGIFYSEERIEKVLNQMLLTRQLADEARTSGLTDDPLVKTELELAVNQALAAAQRRALRKEFEQKVPDQSALAHERYIADPKSFAVSKEVDVRHILISTNQRSDAEAKALAEKLLAELRAKPDDFVKDVKKYSDDPSKTRNHGLIRGANSDRLAVPFRDASAALTHAGEIVGPVKTSYGYHIIKAVKVVPAHQRSFAEVKPELVQKLRDRWVDQQMAEHLGKLRGKDIQVNDKLVRSLLQRYLPSGASGEPPAPRPRIQHMSASQ